MPYESFNYIYAVYFVRHALGVYQESFNYLYAVHFVRHLIGVTPFPGGNPVLPKEGGGRKDPRKHRRGSSDIRLHDHSRCCVPAGRISRAPIFVSPAVSLLTPARLCVAEVDRR